MSADAIAQRITPPTNPLAELSALEKAYEKRWILSTNQLGSILKLNFFYFDSLQVFWPPRIYFYS